MPDYTGKTIYLGIDVHKKSYSVTAILDGCIVKRDRLIALPEVLLNYILKWFKNTIVFSAYEAGFCGFYLHRYLNEHGNKHNISNIVVHPASIEVESSNRVKTDKRDSAKIAIQLSAKRLHCIFIPTREQENERSISRLRETFVKQRSRIAVQLKSLLNLHGIIPWNESPKVSKKWLNKLINLELDQNIRFCISKHVSAWLYYSKEIVEINKKLNSLYSPDSKNGVLLKIYRKTSRGVGFKVGQVLVSELGNTLQFSNEEKLFSFCGLTPTENSSGDHIRRGPISRKGRPVLRKMLIQSSWVAVRKDPYFNKLYDSLTLRMTKQKAIIVVARKLVGRARSLIKKERLFNVETEDRVYLKENFVATS